MSALPVYLECSICYQPISKKTKAIKCQVCSLSYLCGPCSISTYAPNEYTCEIRPGCDVCKKQICRGCTLFCHECANYNEEITIYCTGCCPAGLSKQVCKLHTWHSCDKHKKPKCGICGANRNYAARHHPF